MSTLLISRPFVNLQRNGAGIVQNLHPNVSKVICCVCVCVCVCVGLGWVVGEFQTWRKLFMSQCSKQFTDLFANFVAVLTSHITVVFGNAFGLLSNITTMLFSTVIFLYCLFYFVQVLAFTITISKAHFSITMTSGRKLPCWARLARQSRPNCSAPCEIRLLGSFYALSY